MRKNERTRTWVEEQESKGVRTLTSDEKNKEEKKEMCVYGKNKKKYKKQGK